MRILALRTDKPAAELYIYEDAEKLAEIKWPAHRQLAETIHKKIDEILSLPAQHQSPSGAVGNRIAERRAFGAGSSISLKELDGIVCFKGPGSFTGLRIGVSVANALAYAQKIPMVTRSGEDWLKQGINDILAGKNDRIGTPEYGTPVKTTPPQK